MAEAREKLHLQAKMLPETPGVYLMKGDDGTVLYVGKAKSLKARVSSYFQKSVHEVPRTELLVQKILSFESILTETESEALILECTLIKRHKPRYNVRLKDDKAYPYIKILREDAYPRLEWTRRVLRDGARYFGPFPSGYAAREILRLLTETFKLRDCSDNAFRHRSRPCILYQMEKCTAPCVNLISQADYRESIESAVQVLEGKGTSLIRSLEKEMSFLSSKEEFEKAAVLRDQIKAIAIITETQSVLAPNDPMSRDILGFARSGATAHGVVLQVRLGNLVSVKHYTLENTDPAIADAQVLDDFLAQHYLVTLKGMEKDPDSGPIDYPKEVLVSISPSDPTLLEKTLSITIRVPETKEETQLVQVAHTNANYALEQKNKRAESHGVEALEALQEKLHLPKIPSRIECFDVSNLQGQDAVASRVVFMDGAPDKNLYRRYKIKTVEGANDFAMLKEVLGRRFEPSKNEALPDLLLVDGGKGQLAQAVAILEELGVQGVEVAGIAKARVQGEFHETEVRSSPERLFIPNRKNPIVLLPGTKAFSVVVHLRDEAHRFAITYHRKLRDKRAMTEGGN